MPYFVKKIRPWKIPKYGPEYSTKIRSLSHQKLGDCRRKYENFSDIFDYLMVILRENIQNIISTENVNRHYANHSVRLQFTWAWPHSRSWGLCMGHLRYRNQYLWRQRKKMMVVPSADF